MMDYDIQILMKYFSIYIVSSFVILSKKSLNNLLICFSLGLGVSNTAVSSVVSVVSSGVSLVAGILS